MQLRGAQRSILANTTETENLFDPPRRQERGEREETPECLSHKRAWVLTVRL